MRHSRTGCIIGYVLLPPPPMFPYTINDRRKDVAILSAHMSILNSQMLAADKSVNELRKYVCEMEDQLAADIEAAEATAD